MAWPEKWAGQLQQYTVAATRTWGTATPVPHDSRRERSTVAAPWFRMAAVAAAAMMRLSVPPSGYSRRPSHAHAVARRCSTVSSRQPE